MPDRNGDRADPVRFKAGDRVITILGRKRGIVLSQANGLRFYWVNIPGQRDWMPYSLWHEDELEPDV
jgi:hypothetical protein